MKPAHGSRKSCMVPSSGMPLAVVTFWMCFFMAVRPTRANIVYLWVETDHQAVAGVLDVLSSAQPAGMINLSDVVSFTFTTPSSSYATADLVASTFPISISTSTALFNDPLAGPMEATYVDAALNTHLLESDVALGANSSPPGGFALDFVNGFQTLGGQGYWSLTGQSVGIPEPTSLILGGFSILCGTVCAMVRKRRANRRR